MKAPQVQFTRTSDGATIAFAAAGQGRPVIIVPSSPLSHVELTPQLLTGLYQGMAERFHTAWYDSRGSGLSDRKATDFTRGAMVRDLEAIVDRLGDDTFALIGFFDAVPPALTYAAENPDRVSHLIVGDGRAKTADYFEAVAINAEVALRDLDWHVYTETVTRVLIGFEDPDFAARYAVLIRSCVEQETLREAFAAQTAPEFDVPDGTLESITCPTLVIHNRGNKFLPVTSSQRIAAAIPNSRFQMIDDMKYETVPALVGDFMGVARPAATAPAHAASSTAIVLFADIVDSTGLTERLGDAAFREKARALDGALRLSIRDNAGTPVEGKLLGDGVLAMFQSAASAIKAALACGSIGAEADLPLHLGIHAGDVIREGDNVYGGAVNIAARISALSAPGEVLVSETVRSLARTSSDVRFKDRGERDLKGIGEPVRVWAVLAND